MANNPRDYDSLFFGAQGLRRFTEQLRDPLGGGLGIAAARYPHQIGNASRILHDLQVRHLIADEVGLGKTIQALMILNALRLQDPSLKTLILVPDTLLTQWRDELLTRSHLAPIEAPPTPESDRYTRLAWQRVATPADIDPAVYNMLIVDELHKLSKELQARIVERAQSFSHVLILTATPHFQDSQRLLDILKILEPTRVQRVVEARGGGDAEISPEVLLEELRAREQRRQAEFAGMSALEQDEVSGEDFAQAHCLFRRVIRTKRVDYQDLFPERVHIPITIEPLEHEVQRQELMWDYFKHLTGLSREFDPVRLAKRALLGRQSLQQRVTYLKGHGYEREGILEEVQALLPKGLGDSRLDALVDLLATRWREEPDLKIIVAAQDALTVDYLAEELPRRLPKVGPRRSREELKVAFIRNQNPVADTLAATGDVVSKNVEAFRSGEAQLLLAADAAQVGLNLQSARALILYSVPWRPDEVEQWIGRLDRIGNEAVYGEGEILPIEIYTIAHRGLIDEKIIKVLAAYQVFEHSISLDGDAVEEITALIEEAALEQARLSWEELEARAGEIAVARRSQELTSPLLAALPYGPAHARASTAAAALTPVEPALGDIHADRPADGQREWAMYEWLKLLHEGGEYELRLGRKCAREKRRRFNSIWYTFQLTEHYPKPLHSTVLLPEGIDVNPRRSSSSKHAAAFISRRRDLEQPPAREVYLRRDDPPKPLQFLGYGGRLHDDLVRGWLDQLSETPEVLEVTLPRTHPFFDHAAPGTYALSFGLLEASPMLEALTPDISTLISAEGEPSLKTVSDLFEDAVAATAHSHDLADTRWLRALLPAQLLLELSPLTGTPAPSDSLAAAYALLDPRAVVSNPITDKDEVFLGFGAGVDSPRLLALLNSARGINEDAMLKRGKQSWSHRRPTLRARAESRAWVIEEDATRDADVRAVDVDAREAELEELEGGLLTRRKNELTSRLLIDAMHTSIDARRAARLRALSDGLQTLQLERSFHFVITVARGAPNTRFNQAKR